MKDFVYYMKQAHRYEKALPKLRAMIENIDYDLSQIRIIAYGLLKTNPEGVTAIKTLENKKAALLIQIGRIQGLIQLINSFKGTSEPELKHMYASTLLNMIKSNDKEEFSRCWHILDKIDKRMNEKGLRTVICIGSEKIDS